MEQTLSDEILLKAWELRQKGFYTMREISNKLGVNRDILIRELEAWLPKNAARKIKEGEE